MIRRREALRKLVLIPLAAGVSAGILSVAGCGGNEGLPAIPLGKGKEESQRESELLPGIPIKESAPTKKKR
jgi:hypothetical protein